MKISSAKLKQIIKEEIERFLKEQSAVTIDFEGTTTSIEFLGMETKYDQTEVKLRINGEEYSFGAYDVDGLADDVIAELGDNDDYSKCYLPHMDKENGELMSLNVLCTKSNDVNINNVKLSENMKKYLKYN